MSLHPTLLNSAEAAQMLGVMPHTLEVWRSTGRHRLPYVKIGRLVRYQLEDISEFIAANTFDRHGSASDEEHRSDDFAARA